MNKHRQFRPCHAVRPEVVFCTNYLELPDNLSSIELCGSRPVLAIVGGASKIEAEDMARLEEIFLRAIAPVAERLGATVVDGATDAGVMRCIGQARSQINGTFPLVGVAAVGTVVLPNEKQSKEDAAPLEPNHTHFVFVPGQSWGDESPWLSYVAKVLAGGAPSVTIAINGGEITWQDIAWSVISGRSIIVLSGSGRTADKLAGALRGEATDVRGQLLADSGIVSAIDLKSGPENIAEILTRTLADSFPDAV
jgi:hypothetical protein